MGEETRQPGRGVYKSFEVVKERRLEKIEWCHIHFGYWLLLCCKSTVQTRLDWGKVHMCSPAGPWEFFSPWSQAVILKRLRTTDLASPCLSKQDLAFPTLICLFTQLWTSRLPHLCKLAPFQTNWPFSRPNSHHPIPRMPRRGSTGVTWDAESTELLLPEKATLLLVVPIYVAFLKDTHHNMPCLLLQQRNV